MDRYYYKIKNNFDLIRVRTHLWVKLKKKNKLISAIYDCLNNRNNNKHNEKNNIKFIQKIKNIIRDTHTSRTHTTAGLTRVVTVVVLGDDVFI